MSTINRSPEFVLTALSLRWVSALLLFALTAALLSQPAQADVANTGSKSDAKIEVVEVESLPMIPAIHDVMPIYPSSMKKKGVEGSVTLAYRIDRRGKAYGFRVIDAEPTRIFVRSAKVALKKSRFATTTKKGRPVEVNNQQRSYIYSLETPTPYVASR